MFNDNLADKKHIKEFSVTEISNIVKDLLDNNIGIVKIKGEISGLKIASSGHAYFNLKDDNAILCCTCWRGSVAKLKIKLADGIEVVATGKITSYAGQSRYQLSVDIIEPSGVGAWMQILRERHDKLKNEGLFLESNKVPLPFIPERIGVVTSITGSVIKDIIHRISNRFPTNILIWSVSVQGDNAASEISSAIDGFNNLDDKNKPDVIIVARGGGSIEDLWAFNEEIVVRSTANSKIPIISAVGHETDYTLIDFASDKRAPTPTAAAEFAVPVISDLHSNLVLYYSRLKNAIIQLLKYQQQIIIGYIKILRYPKHYIESNQQKADELGLRLVDAIPNLLEIKSNILSSLTLERITPTAQINYKSLQLDNIYGNLLKEQIRMIDESNQKLYLNTTLLSSLDYKNTLKRGFAIIKKEDGKILQSKQEVCSTKKFTIQFHDGDMIAEKTD